MGIHAEATLVIPLGPGLFKRSEEFRRGGIIAVVPFAEDAGTIAVGLERFGNGSFAFRKLAARFRPGAHAEGMPGGQQHGPGRRANAPTQVVAKFNALFKQAINARGSNGATGVCADVAPAHIVAQQEKNVGFG